MNEIRFTGSVISISSDRNAGYIKPDNGGDDLYFVARQVREIEFEALKPGDKVAFIIGEGNNGRKFANEVRLANKEGSNTPSIVNTRLRGRVKRIFRDEPFGGYIEFDNSTEDIYFFAKEVESGKFETLKIEDKVTFIVGERDGRRSANKIRVVSDSVSNEENLVVSPSPITCDELKEQIIKQFKRIPLTQDANEFEDLVFLLLKTLGIHSLYQYDRRNQAGKADGFFLIGNLAVMYDCTLRQPFEDHKRDQIENYVNKLEQSQLTFDIRSSDGAKRPKTLKIAGKSKQVWIITTKRTREIGDYGNIKVKEISVNDLIWLLQMRLNIDAIEEDELALNLLSRLEKVIPQ